jgi:Sulfatase
LTRQHHGLLAPVAYALVLVLLAARAHQQSVGSDAALVDLPIVERPLHARGGELSIPLPDMAPLRGSVPVLVFQFRNRAADARRIAIALNGFPWAHLSLAPGTDRRFDLPLSKSAAAAMSDGAPWQLQLRGPGGTWALQSLAARTYYARLQYVGAVIPSSSHIFADTAAWPAMPFLLVLAAATVVASTRARRSRLTTMTGVAGAGGLIALAMTAHLSSYRVLVSQATYWVVASLAFLPGSLELAGIGWSMLRKVFSGAGAVARSGHAFWRRHPITLERLSAFLGLCALALAQPVFEVLSPSPDFFVARSTTAADVLLAAATVCVGLPLALTAIEWSLRRISPRAATIFFLSMVAILTGALLLPWLKGIESPGPAGLIAAAIAGGTLVAAGAWQLGLVRQFLSALAPAAIILPALFLLDGHVRGALMPVRSASVGPALARTPPIVVVVFDELPLTSLLQADGNIDAGRYPSFAALARDAFWFRRASTVSANTVWAMPAIATGRYPRTPGSVPTLRYYPDNLFTFLSGRYDMSIFSRFLQLCPESRCHYDSSAPADSVSALLEDLGIVWLHVSVPEALTGTLPPMAGGEAAFEHERRWREQQDDRGGQFDRFLASIDGRPARLNLLHSLLPHMPFEYVPSGRRYALRVAEDERGRGLFWRASRAYTDAVYQRHLLQVGYVDRLVGRLLARLHALGAYDETLIVVTADHGASYQEGTSRRSPRDVNLADIMLVPLFVKLPRQRRGDAIDRNVETVDILPTIASLVGAPLPFEVDGRSLLDRNTPERPVKRIVTVSTTDVRVRDVSEWEPQLRRSLARKLARFGTGNDKALFSTPGTKALLGAPLNRTEAMLVPASAALRITIDNLPAFGDVDLAADPLPLQVGGRIEGAAPPLVLAVAVNGVVVATAVSYERQHRHEFSAMIPETALRQGANDVRVFRVDPERIRAAAEAES